MKKSILTVLTLVSALALAGCGDDNKEAPKAAESAAPAASAPAAPAAENKTAAADIAPECEEYIKEVEGLIAKNPAAEAQFKAMLDQTRSQIATISDKSVQANACNQAKEALKQAMPK
ncbi:MULTISPECIES: DUF5339 family protein [Pelistega]|uniref:DUF5339 family protein n=1 Tax=Pelistega TaxID=106146 RepID=UPI0004211AB0|nr:MULTISPECIES: DUF5339 family protein [Pelistega]